MKGFPLKGDFLKGAGNVPIFIKFDIFMDTNVAVQHSPRWQKRNYTPPFIF
jgi:hypothetical protein